MNCRQMLKRLKALANPINVAGMARFGINPHKTYGVSIPHLRRITREAGTNHPLALELWASGIHEARILASMIDDPARVSASQMDRWAMDFDSWDVCDQVCGNLFGKTKFGHRKAMEWSRREEEFVKRAGFVLIADFAVHDAGSATQVFREYLRVIKREASDDRNFVRKAVNWAVRAIGKRNLELNRAAVETAREIQLMPSKSAKWIAADALRELTSSAVRKRLRVKTRGAASRKT